MPALLDESNTFTVQTFTNPVGARVRVSSSATRSPIASQGHHTLYRTTPPNLQHTEKKNARAFPYDETPSAALVEQDNHPFAMTWRGKQTIQRFLPVHYRANLTETERLEHITLYPRENVTDSSVVDPRTDVPQPNG